MKCAVRRLVAESKNTLAGHEVSAAELESTFQMMLGLLPSRELKDFPVPLGCSPLDVQTEFMRNHYTDWLEWLVDNFSVEWMKGASHAKVVPLLNAFFLEGTPHDAFLVLTETVSTSRYNSTVIRQCCCQALEVTWVYFFFNQLPYSF